VERRFDPFFRPFLDALAQEPVASLIQLRSMRRDKMKFRRPTDETCRDAAAISVCVPHLPPV
jgi:hypothetical protein